MKKHTVKFGLDTLLQKLTEKQAIRWGMRNMPGYLKKAGFTVILFKAEHDINGWDGLRIGYCKKDHYSQSNRAGV